jgi:signal transduction histidine kinase
VKTQAEAMQSQVQSYLNRARIAAQRESVLARTETQPVLERLVRVMRRLNADKQFPLSVDPPGLVLAMEQQDIEETVGNLLENAARHARTTVTTRAFAAPADTRGSDDARKGWIVIEVEDDGPGLEPEEIGEAMKRGKRLDESKPGTGLGLSIVSEIASEYQGTFGLSRGAGGGLMARLVLPAVTKDVA